MPIGPHIPIGHGLQKAIQDARTIGATCIQCFTGNPRGAGMRQYQPKEYDVLAQSLAEAFPIFFCHAPYILNLASDQEDKREFSIDLLGRALDHADRLGAYGLVLHPGSHRGQGRDRGIDLIAAGLEKVLGPRQAKTRILLEGMTGAGHEIGGCLDDLAQIRTRLQGDQEPLICLDTAHLWGAGLDLSDPARLKATLSDHLPLHAIACLHLNDSKAAFGSKKDIHAPLGQGQIGAHTLKGLVQDPFFGKLPMILETPQDLEGWQKEIAMVQSWQQI